MLSSTLGFSIVVPILLAIGPLPPFTHVAALPSQVSEQNVHNDAALHAKRLNPHFQGTEGIIVNKPNGLIIITEPRP